MEPISDMSIEQLTQAVYRLSKDGLEATSRDLELLLKYQELRDRVAAIESSLPDWLKNGNMYPPGLLQTLGIPVVTHQINPQNQITEDEI